MNREIVKELLQHDFNETILSEELQKINSGKQRHMQLKDYQELQNLLGTEPASEKAAVEIIHSISPDNS
jgi:lipid A disaccharide synthetase